MTWAVEATDYYDVGGRCKGKVDGSLLQKVVEGVVVAGASKDKAGARNGLHIDKDSSNQLASCLMALEEEHLVNCVGRTSTAPVWQLTDLGHKHLQVSQCLHRPKPAFRPREGVAMERMDASELHCLLAAAMCLCKVRKKHEKLSGYKRGDAKVFRLRPSGDTFKAVYLRALLMKDANQNRRSSAAFSLHSL